MKLVKVDRHWIDADKVLLITKDNFGNTVIHIADQKHDLHVHTKLSPDEVAGLILQAQHGEAARPYEANLLSVLPTMEEIQA